MSTVTRRLAAATTAANGCRSRRPARTAASSRPADAATAALYKSPEGKALYEKWFTQPIPPRGINLKLPMSEAMVLT